MSQPRIPSPAPEPVTPTEGRLPLGFRVPSEPVDPEVSARRRLAAVVQELSCLLSTSTASAEELNQAADVLASVRTRLRQSPERTFLEAHLGGLKSDEHEGWADRGPVIGRASALAPPVRLSMHGSVARGDVTYDDRFQGGPGCVHGGFVATGFDQVLGAVALSRGVVCLTGKLSVKYRRPTRLYVPLVYEARFVSVAGRAVTVAGTLSDDSGVTAEAEALFVEVERDRMGQLFGEHPTRGASRDSDQGDK